MDPVFAYLEPGSGSLIIQGVIAALIAVPVLFRNKIAAVVRTIRGGDSPDTEDKAVEPGSTDAHPR